MEESTTAIISNLWTKMISLERGDIHKGHSHTFDHTHLLSVGKIKLIADGEESIFEAPCQIFIKKGVDHSMECLSDKSVGTCIHVIRKGFRVEDIADPRMYPKYTEDMSLCQPVADTLCSKNKFMDSSYE